MRVLMVEDNSLDAELLEVTLSRTPTGQYDLTRVDTLADALTTLEEGAYDVVLLDINLPDAQGAEPVKQIALSRNRAPVVVVSALEDEAFAVDMIRAGAQDYVVKGSDAYRNLHRTMLYAVERKETETRLRKLASFDPLTNLANRPELCLQLSKACAHADRHGEMVGVFLIDLDNFKMLNDTLGHAAGDDVLTGVANVLEGSIRRGDTAARIGGDEFCVILEGLHSVSSARVWAGKCLKALNEYLYKHGKGLPLSASIGGCLYPSDGEEVDELLQNADRAMYTVKRQGRSNFALYRPSLDRVFDERQQLESEFMQAMDEGVIAPYLQPKIDVQTGSLCGAEALARWPRENGAAVSPGEFLPIAESNRQMVRLGEIMRRKVFEFQKAWNESGRPPLTVSINVDAQELADGSFGNRFTSDMRRWGIAPEQVRIEITETSLVEETRIVRHNIATLRQVGIGIELDDFGAGHSSLHYLRRFTVDTIKIDRALVSEVGVNQHAATILTALISLARELGLKTVAEGVETSQQLKLLSEIKTDEAQGFLIARPMAMGDFVRWVDAYGERQRERVETMTGRFRVLSEVDPRLLMDTAATQ